MDTLHQLAAHLPIVLIVVGLLLVLIVLYVVFLVVRSSPRLHGDPAPGAPPGEPPALPPGPPPLAGGSPLQAIGRSIDLRRTFRRTVGALRRQLNSRDAVYRLPVFLVVGTAGAETPDFWDSGDLSLPFGPPLEDSQRPDRCNFWIYDHGVVADLGGDYVLRQDGSADEGGFRLALRLLQKYRPACSPRPWGSRRNRTRFRRRRCRVYELDLGYVAVELGAVVGPAHRHPGVGGAHRGW